MQEMYDELCLEVDEGLIEELLENSIGDEFVNLRNDDAGEATDY
jgi:hypothetical protein